MSDLANADAFHSMLQQGPMSDGSWARDGALHLRIADFKTPPKALEYLQVGVTIHMKKWDCHTLLISTIQCSLKRLVYEHVDALP